MVKPEISTHMAPAIEEAKISLREGNKGFGANAYNLLLAKLEITPDQAPIVIKEKNKIVFHSKNFCPTLEACKILELDTREVCKQLSEYPTNEFIRKLNPKLRFDRNYKNLRPYTGYCEEMIILDD